MHLIHQGLQEKELPAMFLLGDRYINTLEKMASSENAKFVVYPADIQGAIKGMLGNIFKK
jgi:regulator of protease activity HflC (stomatin/prohibitin superfamily)